MIYLFVDESGFDETSLSMLGCIISDDAEGLREKIESLKEDVLHNPRYYDISKSFTKNGFHHSENPLEIQREFISLLNVLTFQAYICFIDEPQLKKKGNDLYDILFSRLLSDRLKDYKDESITICFEQHGGKPEKRLSELKSIALRMVTENKKYYQVSQDSQLRVMYGGKDEPCFAITDYILAIFREYYKKRQCGITKGSFQKRDFDNVRSKIRLIHDYKENIFYSRKNPL